MKYTSLKTLFSIQLWENWLPVGIALSILILHLLTIIYAPYLNHDVAQYISMGQMIVDGSLPYTGVVDINPPMIFYISSIPVLIANLLRRSVTMTSIFYFWGLF